MDPEIRTCESLVSPPVQIFVTECGIGIMAL